MNEEGEAKDFFQSKNKKKFNFASLLVLWLHLPTEPLNNEPCIERELERE